RSHARRSRPRRGGRAYRRPRGGRRPSAVVPIAISAAVAAPAGPLLAALGDVWQKRHLAGALDRHRDLALVAPAGAADAARPDLAALGDVAAKLADVLVVDLVDLRLAEEARLAPAAGERREALAAAAVGRLPCC